MTYEEKIQCLKEMGIDVLNPYGNCPQRFGLKIDCKPFGKIEDACPKCWIKALEEPS